MTVKMSIEIDERYRLFAEQMVKDGTFPSVSSVFEAGIAQMMMDNEDNENSEALDPLAGRADEIRSRLALPRDQWVEWDGDELRKRLDDMAKAYKAK